MHTSITLLRSRAGRSRTHAVLLAALFFACSGSAPEVSEIESSRIYDAVEAEFAWNAEPHERFPVRAPERGAPTLQWDLPEGWRELPTSSLRLANFEVAGDERAECYLTILAGDGGGLAANVDRWRGQMSLSGSEDLDQLGKAVLLGEPAVLVDLEGTWTGMGGGQAGEGYRLLGLAQVGSGGARFLKMVGPKQVLDGQVDAFLRLAASLRQDTPARAHASHAGIAQEDPHASAAPLTWEAPSGWQRGPERSMRLVTYAVGEQGEAECYVTILAGDGGGLAANIRRWCDQLGAGALSDTEIDELERFPMLGGEGVLVDVGGHYTGMGEDNVPGARLLGAVRLLGDSSVFVKLIGPGEAVAPARDDFVAFCSSLKESR